MTILGDSTEGESFSSAADNLLFTPNAAEGTAAGPARDGEDKTGTGALRFGEGDLVGIHGGTGVTAVAIAWVVTMLFSALVLGSVTLLLALGSATFEGTFVGSEEEARTFLFWLMTRLMAALNSLPETEVDAG